MEIHEGIDNPWQCLDAAILQFSNTQMIRAKNCQNELDIMMMVMMRIDMDWISWVAGCIDAYLLPLLWGPFNLPITIIIIISTILHHEDLHDNHHPNCEPTEIKEALSRQFWVIWAAWSESNFNYSNCPWRCSSVKRGGFFTILIITLILYIKAILLFLNWALQAILNC